MAFQYRELGTIFLAGPAVTRQGVVVGAVAQRWYQLCSQRCEASVWRPSVLALTPALVPCCPGYVASPSCQGPLFWVSVWALVHKIKSPVQFIACEVSAGRYPGCARLSLLHHCHPGFTAPELQEMKLLPGAEPRRGLADAKPLSHVPHSPLQQGCRAALSCAPLSTGGAAACSPPSLGKCSPAEGRGIPIPCWELASFLNSGGSSCPVATELCPLPGALLLPPVQDGVSCWEHRC